MDYKIILFYKYTLIADPEHFASRHRCKATDLGMKGRLIVATEGINGTFEGTETAIATYTQFLKTESNCADINIKESKGTGNAFPKLSVKVRKEIVASYLDDLVDPTVDTGAHLPPEELDTWYKEGKDFVVLDMRNDYEYASGHFKNSVPSGMKNFRDLPKVLPNLSHLKEKEIVTVCTGGVRCEKASAYLKQNGFKKVYQLHNGMHSYLEKYPNHNFEGALYVFDGRVTIHLSTDSNHSIIGTCLLCGNSTEQYVNCANNNCRLHFLCCENCLNEKKGTFCSDTCREVNSAVMADH